MIRDDISVTSGRSNFSRGTLQSPWFFTRTKSKTHFSDDLSEYSNPSNWGIAVLGPLSLNDHRLVAEGLQARRTVGEAILRAQWEGRSVEDLPVKGESCGTCLGARLPRIRFGFRRREPRPATVFTWAEVDSVLLPPSEENGPYLIVVTTPRCREDGSREWLLQAASRRDRARWSVEMSHSILRAHTCRDPSPGRSPRGARSCMCCATPNVPRIPQSLLMDIVRLCCYTARSKPSGVAMARLVKVVTLLMETQHSDGEHSPKTLQPGAPPLPVAALKRFRTIVKQAQEDFETWMIWWELERLVEEPAGLDALIWRTRVLPFLIPQDVDLNAYPAAVDTQLSNAAKRCHAALCS